jgi:trigger factor
MVDGTPLLMFRLEDGHLLLNLFVLDECNEPLLQIVDNELVYRPDAWDIKLVSNRLTVHEAARRILLEVVFEVPNCIVLRRGRLLCNGVEMLLRPRDVRITNNETRIGASDFPGWTGGLVIGPTQGLSPAIHITGVPRYGNDGSAELEWVESDGDDPAASPASA